MKLLSHSERRVSFLARKKIVFVIVEGPSDETALGVLLSRIYDKNAVHIHIWHGDITSDSKVTPGNILSKVGSAVKSFASSQHYKNIHFAEILHIVDMDGAYISDDCIIEDKSVAEPQYSTVEIRTPERKNIIKRNALKRSNLDKLCGCKDIWSIPYHVYYMSCNLDHVLYGKLNSTDEEKEEDAYQFAKKYKKNPEGFLDYMKKSDFSVMTGYPESWEFIKQNGNSLERHSNLGLALEKEL